LRPSTTSSAGSTSSASAATHAADRAGYCKAGDAYSRASPAGTSPPATHDACAHPDAGRGSRAAADSAALHPIRRRCKASAREAGVRLKDSRSSAAYACVGWGDGALQEQQALHPVRDHDAGIHERHKGRKESEPTRHMSIEHRRSRLAVGMTPPEWSSREGRQAIEVGVMA
jgi:hypothetical protein